MIELKQDNLFHAKVDALVNTVNTVGVMGKGIALQFKRTYPDNFKAYARACKAGEVVIGKMFTFDRGELSTPRFIINFPTKQHWRSPSRLEYIESGLVDLMHEIKRLGITSVAMPALGCSNGGLEWADVKPRITDAFNDMPEVRVLLYEPQEHKVPVNLGKPKKKPNLSLGRALMITLIDLYNTPGYTLGRLEAQKLAYFLQSAGQDLNLSFVKHEYGPYAEAVNHVLQALEGYYIKGYGDRSGASEITVLPGITDEACAQLEPYEDALFRLERVKKLIEGFETPYGMELLASVHWLITQEHAHSYDDAVKLLHGWNERKAHVFRDEHIAIAWNHLDQLGWMEPRASAT